MTTTKEFNELKKRNETKRKNGQAQARENIKIERADDLDRCAFCGSSESDFLVTFKPHEQQSNGICICLKCKWILEKKIKAIS